RVVGIRLLDGTVLRAPAVVLASGGAGQVYLHTTNPAVATGDGVAAAWRAGAAVVDAEFFQFHPTALALPGAPPFLISEAVRGEGGLLLDADGRRFTDELAPRDQVARAIHAQMARQDGAPVVRRIASGRGRACNSGNAARVPTVAATESSPLPSRRVLQHTMWSGVGLIRDADGLDDAARALSSWHVPHATTVEGHEDENL